MRLDVYDEKSNAAAVKIQAFIVADQEAPVSTGKEW